MNVPFKISVYAVLIFFQQRLLALELRWLLVRNHIPEWVVGVSSIDFKCHLLCLR